MLATWQWLCSTACQLDAAVMPVRCAFCGVDCRPGEDAVCKGCKVELPAIENACQGCAAPLLTAASNARRCADCQLDPGPFRMALAPFSYEFPLDAAIRMFKFRRRLHYAHAFGALLCGAFSELPEDIDALLPVPLHWRRHGFRGFNQAIELCKPLRRMTGLPEVRTVRRKRFTQYQSGLSSGERRRNLRDAFVVRGTLAFRHVLIIDDVITTGETTRQLAKVVLAAGAKEASVLALARA